MDILLQRDSGLCVIKLMVAQYTLPLFDGLVIMYPEKT